MEKDRASFILDEHLHFLDDLRESGKVNIFSAIAGIKKVFPNLSDKQTSELFCYWAGIFSKKQEVKSA